MIDTNIITIIILSGLIAISVLYLKDEKKKKIKIKTRKNINTPKKNIINTQPIRKIYKPSPLPNRDLIKEYDHRKIYDPLEEPVRRVPRHWIPPMHIKRLIDIPTQGYPDNFRQFGILKKVDETNDTNKILRLMGRETYPGSNRYEYYTRVSSGNEVINIPIDNKKIREIQDDDVININSLDSEYKAQIFDYDAPKYYPNIL